MTLERHGALACWKRASGALARCEPWHLTLERPKLTLERRRALGTSEVGRTDMERG
jgi:hypothetical protein